MRPLSSLAGKRTGWPAAWLGAHVVGKLVSKQLVRWLDDQLGYCLFPIPYCIFSIAYRLFHILYCVLPVAYSPSPAVFSIFPNSLIPNPRSPLPIPDCLSLYALFPVA